MNAGSPSRGNSILAATSVFAESEFSFGEDHGSPQHPLVDYLISLPSSRSTKPNGARFHRSKKFNPISSIRNRFRLHP